LFFANGNTREIILESSIETANSIIFFSFCQFKYTSLILFNSLIQGIHQVAQKFNIIVLFLEKSFMFISSPELERILIEGILV